MKLDFQEAELHIDVCRLGQQAPALQKQTKLPRAAALRALGLIDDNRVQQAATTHGLDERRFDRADERTELLSEYGRTLRELLFEQHIERRHRDRASEGVSVRKTRPKDVVVSC